MVRFQFNFWKKNSDSIRNEFGPVRFENTIRFGYYSYLLLVEIVE